jgi:hypothetical protein
MDDENDYRTQWGVLRHETIEELPHTAKQVVNQAFKAIAGTIYDKKRLDPNVASNAVSRSIFTHRPVRSESDAGRIGVEIDGAEFLFDDGHPTSPGQCTRRISLMLAAKLSADALWEDYEMTSKNGARATAPTYRPVLVCFNTIKQALIATRELQRLKLEELSRAQNRGKSTRYDNIRIQCLADGIPFGMHLDRTVRRRYRGLSDGIVNAKRGLVMIVQPTDYNAEYPPPGPAVGAVNNFQRLVAQASVEELPIVALSPRFLSNDAPFGGWDQSGYQKSATYGGLEPPKGPSPWVMRDFSPPIYCWIGNAMSLGRPPRGDVEHEMCHLSRVALTQSVMDEGHSWHMYAAKDCTRGIQKFPTSYVYLASTRSASGRPTRDLIIKILEDVI